jgi:hypothetical protein
VQAFGLKPPIFSYIKPLATMETVVMMKACSKFGLGKIRVANDFTPPRNAFALLDVKVIKHLVGEQPFSSISHI